MGKVSDRIRQLIARQVKTAGLVVWYDPEKAYSGLAGELGLPETDVILHDGSYFRTRHHLELYLEWVTADGQAKDGCGVPPKVVVYVPDDRASNAHALIEAETCGVVLEPGAETADRNSRLRIQAEALFQDVAPEKAAHLARQVEEGLLSLADLDRIADEVGHITSGALKLVYSASSPIEILIEFASSPGKDALLMEKKALGEVRDLAKNELGLDIGARQKAETAREELQRLLLLGDYLLGIPAKVRPANLESVPLPESAAHQDALRHLCEVWRNRIDFREAYAEAARRWEAKAGIPKIDLTPALEAGLQTFPCIERALLHASEESVLKGADLPALATRAASRKTSFWSREDAALAIRWSALELATRFLIAASNASAELKKAGNDPRDLVRAYATHADPWMMADRHYRHWETRLQSIDADEAGAEVIFEQLTAKVRHDYAEWADRLCRQFVAAFETSGFEIEDLPQQNSVWKENIQPALDAKTRVAYLIVDALRYEMAVELVEGLDGEFGIEIQPALGTLPSITPVGMAALMPGADQEMEILQGAGSIVVSAGKAPLKDRAARMARIEEKAGPGVVICKLSDLLKVTAKRKKDMAAARLVVVTSQEIDRLGEDSDDQGETRRWMDEMIEQLRRGLRALARIGIQRIVVTADHGHLFADHFDPGMLMDSPGGTTVEIHSRAWIGKGGNAAEGFVRIPASQLGLGGALEFAFPRGHACFKVRGGAGGYFHGGISLQELVIPLAVLTPKATAKGGHGGVRVVLDFAKPAITNRFFTVTARIEEEGLFGPEEIRVRAVLESPQGEAGFCAMAAYGYEEGTREILLKRGQPNALTFMLSGSPSQVAIRVTDCSNQLDVGSKTDIPVKLSI